MESVNYDLPPLSRSHDTLTMTANVELSAEPVDDEGEYVIIEGDTLQSIADAHNTTRQALWLENRDVLDEAARNAGYAHSAGGRDLVPGTRIRL